VCALQAAAGPRRAKSAEGQGRRRDKNIDFGGCPAKRGIFHILLTLTSHTPTRNQLVLFAHTQLLTFGLAVQPKNVVLVNL
jgi:hypothetical protein